MHHNGKAPRLGAVVLYEVTSGGILSSTGLAHLPNSPLRTPGSKVMSSFCVPLNSSNGLEEATAPFNRTKVGTELWLRRLGHQVFLVLLLIHALQDLVDLLAPPCVLGFLDSVEGRSIKS